MGTEPTAMCSFTGERLTPDDPSSFLVSGESLAHSLAAQPRWLGHARYHYSCAQHAVNLSLLVPRPLALAALLHNAPRTCLMDLPPQLKAMLPGYRRLERRLLKAVFRQYGVTISGDGRACMDRVDRSLTALERHVLVFGMDVAAGGLFAPLSVDEAKRAYLTRLATIESQQRAATAESPQVSVRGALTALRLERVDAIPELDYRSPDLWQFNLYDIANRLASVPRFAGHTKTPYSVAQHSVLVSQLVPERLALEALLHDSAEAYCLDLPTPVKRGLPEYKAIENRVQAAILTSFGIADCSKAAEIVVADKLALRIEQRDLMRGRGGWNTGSSSDLDGIEALTVWAPDTARSRFLEAFDRAAARARRAA